MLPAITATAMSAAPAEHSGIASAVNNDVARAAGLIAVAVLPTLAGITGDAYLHPAELTQGFHTAVLIAGVASAAAGILAAATIRNPPRPARLPEPAVPAAPDRALELVRSGRMPLVRQLVARRLTEDLARAPGPVDRLVAMVGDEPSAVAKACSTSP